MNRARVLALAYEVLSALIALWASYWFAVSYGYNFGYDNHATYLVGALRLHDPAVLTRDWLAAECTPYHPIFGYIGWALWALDEEGWGFAYANVAAVTAIGLSIYAICRAFAGSRLALPVFLVPLAFAMQTRTHSVAVSYIADFIIQPSTLGGLGWTAGIAAFLTGRWLLSGVLFGLGGLLHANYLVLGFPVLGMAHLLIENPWDWRSLVRRLVRQLGPSVVALLILSPVIFATASHPDADRAREIFQTIRSPHHYMPLNFTGRFMPLGAWQVLGIGAAWPLLRGRHGPGPRLAALLIAIAVLLWSGTFLTTWTFVPSVSQLFPWRVAPFSDLLAQVALAGAAASLVCEPARVREYPKPALLLVVAGVVMLCVDRAKSDSPWISRILLGTVVVGVVGTLVGLGFDALVRRTAPRNVSPIPIESRVSGGWPTSLAAAFAAPSPLPRYAAIALMPLALLLWNRVSARFLTPTAIERESSLLHGFDSREEALYRWIRENTPTEARFLQPPLMERFRISSRRAIVVDWKSAPILPDELLEWYVRLGAVAGRSAPRGSSEVGSGYDAMDSARLRTLRDRYAVDFAVVRRGREASLKDWPVVYSNAGYAVLDLRSPRPE
ncbi:MAG: hypothetical protein JW751_26620 [Polyangiaceae bacterium]|nr:hypothetical protein [Polyangiaceae bacterium]